MWIQFCVKLMSLLYQDLDQEQSLQLLQMFLIDAYRGNWKEIGSKIGNEFERHNLLQQIQSYYFSERLYALRCLKHLLGYWQDPNHPYRVSLVGWAITHNSLGCLRSLLRKYILLFWSQLET